MLPGSAGESLDVKVYGWTGEAMKDSKMHQRDTLTVVASVFRLVDRRSTISHVPISTILGIVDLGRPARNLIKAVRMR